MKGLHFFFNCIKRERVWTSRKRLPVLCFDEHSPLSPSGYIKHLMTGPKGNSKFCFPETLNVPRGEEVEGKQNTMFHALNSKVEKNWRNRLLCAGWLTNLPWFQGARPVHVQVESSCCCFPRELVSFVRPRELVSFDPRHVRRFPPIGKRIWVGRYNNPGFVFHSEEISKSDLKSNVMLIPNRIREFESDWFSLVSVIHFFKC